MVGKEKEETEGKLIATTDSGRGPESEEGTEDEETTSEDEVESENEVEKGKSVCFY